MNYYVRIPRINGRWDHMNVGIWLNNSGIGEVEYFEGGWSDTQIDNIAPHLRFEREEDALAYILAKGGTFSREVPTKSTFMAIDCKTR